MNPEPGQKKQHVLSLSLLSSKQAGGNGQKTKHKQGTSFKKIICAFIIWLNL